MSYTVKKLRYGTKVNLIHNRLYHLKVEDVWRDFPGMFINDKFYFPEWTGNLMRENLDCSYVDEVRLIPEPDDCVYPIVTERMSDEEILNEFINMDKDRLRTFYRRYINNDHKSY